MYGIIISFRNSVPKNICKLSRNGNPVWSAWLELFMLITHTVLHIAINYILGAVFIVCGQNDIKGLKIWN